MGGKPDAAFLLKDNCLIATLTVFFKGSGKESVNSSLLGKHSLFHGSEEIFVYDG